MSKKNVLLINTDGPEHRVALVENGSLAELYIERKLNGSNVGNIYKGRIVRVMPGMQAAFVDIGMEKAAFLYITDVVGGRVPNKIRLYLDSESDVDGELDDDEELLDLTEEDEELFNMPRIEDLLSPGQDILVQVAKDPLGTKGSRVTGYVTLPGRHIVFMPYVDHIGISRKIEDEEERTRLKDIVEELKQNLNGGFIVRTVSEGQSNQKLKNDMEYLSLLWKTILDKYNSMAPPCLIYSELDLVIRCVRDLMNNDIDSCYVDSRNYFNRVQEFVGTFMPKYLDRIKLYEGEIPIFDSWDLEPQIDQALTQKVWLKSGGYLVIERTEALTTIDVNSGSYVGNRSLEDTITQINMEAAREIPLQLRLRNIGGLVVIDFIDMQGEDNKQKVMQIFSEELAQDRARHMVLPISEFGLMQMTRQRTRESLISAMTRPCSYCRGRGYIKSIESICIEIIRNLIRRSGKAGITGMRVNCNLEVADYLTHAYQEWLTEIENRFGIIVNLHALETMHAEDYEISEERSSSVQ
ncbi:Rne/Rng family ribonuclease [Myxococcota bacterium]|nr:Rne/Rng family ribonuclease [Myxococcota bacterium]MBU1382004.1 Rne/Rng family ribonuclease [Myxococcota bacterium]MBU1497659.1 Rne/Rng family ribonuclease [Myxococcota bacterium]